MTDFCPLKHRTACWAGCSRCSFPYNRGSQAHKWQKNMPYDSFLQGKKVFICFIHMTWHAIFKYTWRSMSFESWGEDYQWIILSSIYFPYPKQSYYLKVVWTTLWSFWGLDIRWSSSTFIVWKRVVSTFCWKFSFVSHKTNKVRWV